MGDHKDAGLDLLGCAAATPTPLGLLPPAPICPLLRCSVVPKSLILGHFGAASPQGGWELCL